MVTQSVFKGRSPRRAWERVCKSESTSYFRAWERVNAVRTGWAGISYFVFQVFMTLCVMLRAQNYAEQEGLLEVCMEW